MLATRHALAANGGEENVGWRSGMLASLHMAALAVSGAVACGGSPKQPVAAEITTFEPPSGALQPGSPATVSVRVKNTGAEEHTLWIGSSVQDAAGGWHDAPASPVGLAAGEESHARELATGPLETPGYYKVRVSVWSEEPKGEKTGEDEDAGSEPRRLANVEDVSAFRISSTLEDFDTLALDPDRWEATTRHLGRGDLVPENVDPQDGQLRLTLPAGTLGGGEIRSKDRSGPGFYAARIKVPDAPSSITGFFLYAPPDYASEIDIELYNDSSRKILFATYAGGKQTHSVTLQLPFDPAEDYHDYAFFYDRTSVTFYVDGKPMQTYEGGLPDRPMGLYVNSWFPTWIPGEEPNSDRYAQVAWIESLSASADSA